MRHIDDGADPIVMDLGAVRMGREYEYWHRLARANEDYRRDHDHRDDYRSELEGFRQWMRQHWGIEMVTGQHYAGIHIVVDPRLFLLFNLKYA